MEFHVGRLIDHVHIRVRDLEGVSRSASFRRFAARVGVATNVHALRAAFAVQFDEQNPAG